MRVLKKTVLLIIPLVVALGVIIVSAAEELPEDLDVLQATSPESDLNWYGDYNYNDYDYDPDQDMDDREDDDLEETQETEELPSLLEVAETTISVGSLGADVSWIQQMLAQLGYFSGVIDGAYGPVTMGAVQRFQEDQGLYVDGEAGPVTVAALRGFDTADQTATVDQGASSQTQAASDDMDDSVSSIQRMLAQLGYFNGTVDGIYGPVTTAAVTSFQADQGIYTDGDAGPVTLAALRRQLSGSQGSTATQRTSSQTQAASDDMDDSVSSIQRMLAQLGYFNGTVDGIYGPVTTAAVISFQADQGIYTDGDAGPVTLAALRRQLSGSEAPSAAQSESSTTSDDSYVTDDSVSSLQRMLTQLGYFSGVVDGAYGPVTTAAVRSFQAANGLYEDGIAGPLTLEKLRSVITGGNANEEIELESNTNSDAGIDVDTAAAMSDLLTPEVVEHIRGIIDTVVTPDMTPNEKLWAVFDYIGNRNNYPYMQNRIPHYDGEDWPLVYAEDMMNEGGSDCHGTAALFGYAASMLGYDEDDLHWASNGYHAWVDIDGLIYDPVFTNSSYHTTVYGYTYPEGQAVGLGAGFEDLSTMEGTFQYIKVPKILG